MNDYSAEDAFHILAEFLDKVAAAAEGHAREELTPEQEVMLRTLAAGELDEQGRTALISLLAHNVVAMEFLAKVAI